MPDWKRMATLTPLTDDDVDRMLGLPVAVLYKHSPSCGASRWAMTEVQQLAEDRPGTPIFVVDVIRQRPLARQLAQILDVAHASPQVLVLDHGDVTWHGSHSNVRAAFVEEQLDLLQADEPKARSS
jgi:bacillithiol system protein YtxJ